MAGAQYSISLTDPGFPFRTDFTEQAALADEIPNARIRKITPRVLHVKNAIPCKEGFDSLDSQGVVTGIVGAKFDKVYSFFTPTTFQKALFSPAYGKAYILLDGQSVWDDKLNLGVDVQSSIAYLRGATYFYFRNFGAYKYNEGTTNLDTVTLTGLTISDIIGITSASGYTIAFTNTTIYYTSRLEVANAIDFTPLLGTAGSAQALAIKGEIVTCLPYANGFVIYTKDNAVMASYSGQPNQPFIFREIPGSAGVVDEEFVAWETNIGIHYAWTKSGLQAVQPGGAQNVFPELLDFIRLRTVEDLNETTGEITRTEYAVDMAIKIALVGHRFLCISYGETNVAAPTDQTYEGAFIYDTDLRRWGKIEEVHVDIFPYTFTGGIEFLTFNDLASTTYNALSGIRFSELTTQDPGGATLSYKIGLLQLDGTVTIKSRANMAGASTGNEGRIVLGGIAVKPENMTEVQEFRCKTSQMSSVKWFSSRYSDNVVIPDIVTTGQSFPLGANLTNQRFLQRVTARSHNLMLKGRFHLTDANCWLEEVGDR